MECNKILQKEMKLIIGTWYRFGDDTISKRISEVAMHEDLREQVFGKRFEIPRTEGTELG